MKTELLPNETVIKEGIASLHITNWNWVGGRLTLTNQRLVFELDAPNPQTGMVIIPLVDIGNTTLRSIKLLNWIPIARKSLAVAIKDLAFALSEIKKVEFSWLKH